MKPQPNKVYRLTGGPHEPCIANGNTWAASEVITEPSCDLTKVKGTELTSDAATPILNKSETTPARKDPR